MNLAMLSTRTVKRIERKEQNYKCPDMSREVNVRNNASVRSEGK